MDKGISNPASGILLIRCDPSAFEGDGTERRDWLCIGIERVLVGTEYVNNGFMVNQLFHHEGHDVKTDDIGVGNKVSIRRCLVFDIKVFRMGQLFKAPGNLFFKRILAGGFHQVVFHQFQGDGVA